MHLIKGSFAFLQKIGKALMLPVAVLPVAGLLLGLGAAHFAWIPDLVSGLMKNSGDAIFGNLPLIFAIGVALGLTENDGVSAIAAAIGYVVMLATLGVMAPVWHVVPVPILGIPAMQTGVFGGMLAGGLAAALFNRFYRIALPPYLGFFAGKRFVPIVTALCAILLGVALSLVWPPIQNEIDAFSHWAAVSNPRTAATVYGFIERLLIPFGLHHIWNVPFFFEMGSYTDATGKVVRGDINRFFAGDPTAGVLAGAFFFKMFGLPAAAIAIWRSARPEQRTRVAGIMISAALTSFLTGITEPIEFAFLFVAPVLYLVHAVLAASAQFVANTIGLHMGFTFSQGAIDYVMFNLLGKNARGAWYVLLFGPLYAGIYYATFRYFIVRFDLKTPGRETEPTEVEARRTPAGSDRAREVLAGLGGARNVASLDACITRLRVTARSSERIDAAKLKRLGAVGVVVIGNGVQAIFGAESENLKTSIEDLLKTRRDVDLAPARAAHTQAIERFPSLPASGPNIPSLLRSLGGRDNIARLQPIAHTRLRIELKDPAGFDSGAATDAGVKAFTVISANTLHLIVGPNADSVAAAMCLGQR